MLDKLILLTELLHKRAIQKCQQRQGNSIFQRATKLPSSQSTSLDYPLQVSITLYTWTLGACAVDHEHHLMLRREFQTHEQMWILTINWIFRKITKELPNALRFHTMFTYDSLHFIHLQPFSQKDYVAVRRTVTYKPMQVVWILKIDRISMQDISAKRQRARVSTPIVYSSRF
jgi:hypothetical protein